MAGRDGSDKREALARRRTVGRIRLSVVVLLLGCLLGSTLTAVLLKPSESILGTDHTPPFVMTVAPDDGSILAAGNVSFRIEFSEPLLENPVVSLEGIEVLSFADETFYGLSWQGVATIPPGGDGPYRLTVTSARDLARNTMADHEISYEVDTVLPEAHATTGFNRTSSPFVVTWTSSDGDGSGIARVELWKRDDVGPWTLLTAGPDAVGAFRVDPGEREATFGFCALAVDRSGNHDGPCEVEAALRYDGTPPSASLLPHPYWAVGPVQLTGIATNDATVADLCYHFAPDNLTWQGPFCVEGIGPPFRWNFAFPLGGGHYRLSARGQDVPEGIEPLQTPQGSEVALGFDREAPASRVDPITTYWHQGPVSLFGNASDDESGVASMDLFYSYRPREDEAWSAWALAASRVQPPWRFSFDVPEGDGRYEFATRARDGAGREEALPPLGQGDVALGYNREPPDAATMANPKFVDPATRRTNVTWIADPGPAPDVFRFEVHRGTTAAFTPDGTLCQESETCVTSLGRDVRTAWVPLLQENVTYYVRVRTIDDGGWPADTVPFGAVFHGLDFDTPDTQAQATPLHIGVAWSERLHYEGACHDCTDVFRVDLESGESLALSLAVPPTGDFRLLVLDAHGNLVAESRNSGFGVWESLLVPSPVWPFGTYYVIVDWSNVTGSGPEHRNEGWYTLAPTVVV